MIVVEVFVLSCEDAELRYRRLTRTLPEGTAPDDLALALSAADSLCHSTSWRWEDGGIVVTYAALPDPHPAGSVPLGSPAIVTSSDPLRPRPEHLHDHHVAAHAVRHLDYLSRTDPTVARATRAHPHLWHAIASAAADVPVRPHDDLGPHHTHDDGRIRQHHH